MSDMETRGKDLFKLQGVKFSRTHYAGGEIVLVKVYEPEQPVRWSLAKHAGGE